MHSGLMCQHVVISLRTARTLRGVSRTDYAQAIGVSPKTLSRIESLRRELRIDELWKGAVFLKVEFAAVFPKPILPLPSVMDNTYIRSVLASIDRDRSVPFGVEAIVEAVGQVAGIDPKRITVPVGGNARPIPLLRAVCGMVSETTPWVEVQEMAYHLGYRHAVSLHQCIRRYRQKPDSHPVWKCVLQARALLKSEQGRKAKQRRSQA